MAAGRIEPILQHLRRAALRPEAAHVTDGRLLDRFVAHRDAAAFEALVRRHGPMVLGVCRRVLRDPHDAEDAFQATFLVLARRADSVWPRERVGNWLYGVGHRTALAARAANARRRARERSLADLPEPEAVPHEPGADVHALLDEELARLPDKYRLSIVLCDLERRTRREVARQFQIPEGTLSSRLTTARKLLARRLARRGLAVPGGSLALVLSRRGTSVRVPVSLVQSTVNAAAPIAAGPTTTASGVSVPVIALTEGVLRSMVMTKLKTAGAAIFLGAVVLGGGLLACQGDAAQPPATGGSVPAEGLHSAPAPAAKRDAFPVVPPLPRAEDALPQAVADYKAAFDRALAVVSEYFTLEDINRYEGRIDTFPALVKRTDSGGTAIRRRASVRILPRDEGTITVEVRVFKEAQSEGRSPHQRATWKPIGRDTELEQTILKRLKAGPQDGEPAADRRPRVVERRTRQYHLEFLLVKAGPGGRDFGKDGKGKVLSEPHLIVLEGTDGCISVGGQVAVPGDGKDGVEFLNVGMTVRAKVVGLGGDRMRLETVLERTKLDRADEKSAQTSGRVVRSIAVVKLGEGVKLTDEDAPPRLKPTKQTGQEDASPDRYWLRVRVVQEETILSQSRSAATARTPPPE